MTKKNSEYAAFNELAGKLLSVPHSELKKKLDAEAQSKKRKKSRTSSASGRVAGAKD
jgi:hypothetical protein